MSKEVDDFYNRAGRCEDAIRELLKKHNMKLTADSTINIQDIESYNWTETALNSAD